MHLINTIYLHHDGNKCFSVTPHFKDGRHLVVGLKHTKFNGRRWYLDDYELKHLY